MAASGLPQEPGLDRGGELVARWWALLPGADDDPTTARRRTQGSAFYRSGRVAGLRIGAGRLAASVQGARATPYHVEVLLAPLDDATWAALGRAIAGDLRVAAALLAGRWPEGLAASLADDGIDVLGTGEELDLRCPCGEAERPCAHLVALWVAAAERFAADPFALLAFRGRGRQRLLADLAAGRRSRSPAAEARVPLDALAPADWMRAPLPPADLVPPPTPRRDAAPLRLLGDPPGWAGAASAREVFAPLVAAAADAAEALARGEPLNEP